MATAEDKARDAGLTLRSGDYRQPCPQCSPTRKKKKDPCLHVTAQRGEVKACCHHCGWGMIYTDDQHDDYSRRQYGSKRPEKPENNKIRWW